eukprot:364975-Chlamydomonas_euryale.AAC.2
MSSTLTIAARATPKPTPQVSCVRSTPPPVMLPYMCPLLSGGSGRWGFKATLGSVSSGGLHHCKYVWEPHLEPRTRQGRCCGVAGGGVVCMCGGRRRCCGGVHVWRASQVLWWCACVEDVSSASSSKSTSSTQPAMRADATRCIQCSAAPPPPSDRYPTGNCFCLLNPSPERRSLFLARCWAALCQQQRVVVVHRPLRERASVGSGDLVQGHLVVWDDVVPGCGGCGGRERCWVEGRRPGPGSPCLLWDDVISGCGGCEGSPCLLWDDVISGCGRCEGLCSAAGPEAGRAYTEALRGSSDTVSCDTTRYLGVEGMDETSGEGCGRCGHHSRDNVPAQLAVLQQLRQRRLLQVEQKEVKALHRHRVSSGGPADMHTQPAQGWPPRSRRRRNRQARPNARADQHRNMQQRHQRPDPTVGTQPPAHKRLSTNV